MESNKRNNRAVFKATAVLGSVQFFNIIIGVLKNKVASILLGPSGLGIVGLLTSTTSIINGFSNCGLTTSVVKNISVAYENGDKEELSKVVSALKRLLWGTSILGASIMILLSRQLSLWTFGNTNYTFTFIVLSLSIIITQFTNGNIVILNGCRKISLYAKANVLGNFLSLLITIPLYYIWGIKAAAPVIILMNLATLICSYIYVRSLKIEKVELSKRDFGLISKDVLKIGISIAAAEIFPIMSSYLIRLHVANNGGAIDVGLYTAGFAILNGYVGMIFNAMSTDYIPRLSAIIEDNKRCEVIMNDQIRLSMAVLFPILSIIIVFGTLVVLTLYTAEFLPMVTMIYWGAIGMLLKAMNWCMGCLLVPKRESVIYFIFSIISTSIYMGTSIWFYNKWGITGLGVAFVFSHLWDIVTGILFYKWRYNIGCDKDNILHLIFYCFILLCLIGVNTLITSKSLLYLINTIILLIVILFSCTYLNRLLDIKSFLLRILKK